MTEARSVLVVDDEPDLRRLIGGALQHAGFDVALAATGRDALAAVARSAPDLVVLDLMLPDLSGTEVCRALRSQPATAEIPIIMLTARGDEIDRVVGFELGADDYVVKSTLSLREFVLRVRSVLRRPRTAVPDASLRFGALRIDTAAHRAFVDEEELLLTVTEFRLLSVLASRAGKVVSRSALLRDVWQASPTMVSRTVDTHVKRLRGKLGEAGRLVKTVRGVGYRFAGTED
jgi:two-component system phosphate regulon response regulator PhoB